MSLCAQSQQEGIVSASSDYLRVVTDLEHGKGATAAATQRANAQIWGSAISQLGDYASDAIKQYAVDKKAKKAEQEDQALRDLFTTAQTEFEQGQQPSVQQQTGAFSGPLQPGHTPPASDLPEQGGIDGTLRPRRTSPFPTPAEILHQVGPIRGIPIINGIAALHMQPQQDPEKNLARLQTVWKALDALPEDKRAEYYPHVIDLFEQQGILPPGQVDKAYKPEEWQAIGATLKGEKTPTRVMKTVQGGVPGEAIVADTPGQFFPSEPAKPPASRDALLIDSVNPTSPTRAQSAQMLKDLPPDATPDRNPTEASLALQAANGDPAKALGLLKAQKSSAEGGAVAIPGQADVPDVPQGEKNETYLRTLPSSQASLVKALSEGRKAFPAGAALRSDYWQGILGAVAKYDPTFDEINYGSRAATRKDFTSGKSAQQINALNTVVGHIAQLSDAAEALNNKDSRTYNAIANKLQTEFGWTGKTDFDTIAPKVAQELTRVWRGTGGSEADISRDIQALGSSNTPAQLHSSIANLGGLVESKLEALKETYRQGMGTEDIEMITPAARKALDRLETRAGRAPLTSAAAPASGGMIEAKDPQGQIHHAPAGTPLPAGWVLVTK